MASGKKEGSIYLDTHAVVWLYAGQIEKFPDSICQMIEVNNLLVSPMLQLELQYLHEIERIKVTSAVILENLNVNIGLNMGKIPFERIIAEAVTYNWTRDPFDRFIVASAAVGKTKLITKDKNIRDHFANAVWE